MLGNFVTFEEQNKTGSNNERAQYSFGEKFIRQLKGVVCVRCERQVVSARGAGNEAAAHKILKTDKRRATHQLLRISFLAEKRKKRRKTITKTSSLCGIYTSGCCCVWDKDQESPSEPGRAAMRQTTPLSYTSSSKATDRLGSHTLSPRNLKRGIPVCTHSLSCSLHGLKPADGMSSKSVVKAP